MTKGNRRFVPDPMREEWLRQRLETHFNERMTHFEPNPRMEQWLKERLEAHTDLMLRFFQECQKEMADRVVALLSDQPKLKNTMQTCPGPEAPKEGASFEMPNKDVKNDESLLSEIQPMLDNHMVTHSPLAILETAKLSTTMVSFGHDALPEQISDPENHQGLNDPLPICCPIIMQESAKHEFPPVKFPNQDDETNLDTSPKFKSQQGLIDPLSDCSVVKLKKDENVSVISPDQESDREKVDPPVPESHVRLNDPPSNSPVVPRTRIINLKGSSSINKELQQRLSKPLKMTRRVPNSPRSGKSICVDDSSSFSSNGGPMATPDVFSRLKDAPGISRMKRRRNDQHSSHVDVPYGMTSQRLTVPLFRMGPDGVLWPIQECKILRLSHPAPNHSKYCEYHGQASHATFECYILKDKVRNLLGARKPEPDI